jgi:ABC-type Fe3+-hydroxamate transport system substrate-binding protein
MPHRIELLYHRGVRLVEDALERHIEVPDTPRRIVSLVPSLTELLFAVGAGERVVGVSRYCSEPAGRLDAMARVGGQKDPDREAIAALAPDLVLAVKEENLARDVAALADRGLQVYVADVHTVEDALALIGEVGDLVDGEPQLVEELRAAAAAGVAEARRLAPVEPVPVFCPIWRDPWITISPDTYMFDVLRSCGGRAVPAGRPDQRYPKVKLDAVRAARPRCILLPDEPYRFGPADAAELAAIAPAHLVDGKLLGWYGVRTAGIAAVARLLVE